MQALKNMSITAIREAYKQGTMTPTQLLKNIHQQAEATLDHNIWIYRLNETELAPYLDALKNKNPETHPLWGIPFAIKDNIDLAGIPTTAGCEAFRYTPDTSATVVAKLIAAGAIPVGKTNLDQFATGLNGTRSPWGACKNAFNPAYICGGSSSGSAVAVALGLAAFSLGTDTAGSGRVPACFNNLIGVKPSRGLLSNSGMVPACKSLDCMTIFAQTLDDANALLAVAEGYDSSDAYSRANPFINQSRQYGNRQGSLNIGVIPKEQLDFFADQAYANAYTDTLNRLKSAGVNLIDIDYQPFIEAANLLYQGPWVAERYVATQPLIDNQPEAIFPVVRNIISAGKTISAADAFKAQYQLQALAQQCQQQLADIDCLLTPTAGRCFTIDEMLAEPVLCNTQLGYYTNFMNLLDLAAISIPTQIASNSIPFGITLAGKTFSDRALLSIARRLQPLFPLPLGASQAHQALIEASPIEDNNCIDVLVCGAHLDGLPLNWQLQERGATLKQKTQTAPVYRMFALAGKPARPGLIRDENQGAAIDVEIWKMPSDQLGSFLQGIPEPLGLGKVEISDGSMVTGFICEGWGAEGSEEITRFGGWRGYLS